ncbi:MAG: DUF5615 family PIN-like protein [Bacillota bacterium]|nr:DUF5615 family PIN-like protein [Bacillota bacterium]
MIDVPWKAVDVSETEGRALGRLFRKRPRFLADENVWPEIVDLVRSKGVNIKPVRELGLKHRDDAEVLRAAQGERRLLLTFDKRFWDDRKYPLRDTAGIVVLDQGSLDDVALEVAILLGNFTEHGEMFHRSKTWLHPDGTADIKVLDDTGRVDAGRLRFRNQVEEWVDD